MKKRNHMPICSYACSVKGSLDKGMEETFLDILQPDDHCWQHNQVESIHCCLWYFCPNIFHDQLANSHMTIAGSIMKWSPSIVVFGIFVLNIFHDQLANSHRTIPGSRMVWISFIVVFGIFVLNIFRDQVANSHMTILGSRME